LSYASTTGIDDKFGPSNVTQWADLNNNGNAGEITARKTAAISYADAEVDAALRDTHYRKPLVTASGATPSLIADVANALAGCWLRDARGQDAFTDQGDPLDSLTWHRTRAHKILDQIKAGELSPDAI
jgi:phage gp36-like protein